LKLVTLEVEEIVKGTALDGAPVIAVSSVTGDGVPELLAALDKMTIEIQPRKDIGRPRLLIDRSFSIAGSGTVVTGTLIDGSLQQGQEAELQPSGAKVRIRGLQSHKSRVERVGPGTRVAANLVGVSPSEVNRGDVLTTPGCLFRRSVSMHVCVCSLRINDSFRTVPFSVFIAVLPSPWRVFICLNRKN
jgi:selenocysteine-specific elongation factor